MNPTRLLLALGACAVASAAPLSTHAMTIHGAPRHVSLDVNAARPDAPSSLAKGQWTVASQDGANLWAHTNGDGGALGQYCNVQDRSCAWLLVVWGVTCNQGDQHPVLVNTDREASQQVIQCAGAAAGLGSVFAFVEFDRIDAAIRQARAVGIAVPEQGEEIHVVRFKLDGALAAIDGMRDKVAMVEPDDEAPE